MNQEQRQIKAAKEGDLSALNDLIQSYYIEIYKYCFWHIKNKEQAEDITQETFYKAIRFLNAYKNSGTFRAFLYCLMRLQLHIFKNRCRKADLYCMPETFSPGFSCETCRNGSVGISGFFLISRRPFSA